MALTPRVALTRPPLKLHAASTSAGDGGLELGLAAVPEAGAHPEKILARRVALDWGPEAEEGVVLDGALPQVLASFLVVKPANKLRNI